MLLDSYRKAFHEHLEADAALDAQLAAALEITRRAPRLIFVGNGGSNAICSHMMEDFIKVARKPALSFTDPALITCFANDYGYPQAMQEWLRVLYQPGDCLYAISSSGESANILHAARFVKEQGSPVITLSGFKAGNSLSQLGDVNFHVPVASYGIVECMHQTYIHIILDQYASEL